MKISHAARYNAVLWPGVLFYTISTMLPGLRVSGVHFPRQGWIVDHLLYWAGGWGLWLMAILGWMWLLVALVWHYLPTQRMEFSLQLGLIFIATGLAISGGIVWLAMLPAAMRQATATTLSPLVDALALGLIGGGALLGGAVTTWVGWDLYRRKALSRTWLWLCIGAGLCALPTPFVLPFPYLLLLAALVWWGWSIYLMLRLKREQGIP
jgi:hypothetical protein